MMDHRQIEERQIRSKDRVIYKGGPEQNNTGEVLYRSLPYAFGGVILTFTLFGLVTVMWERGNLWWHAVVLALIILYGLAWIYGILWLACGIGIRFAQVGHAWLMSKVVAEGEVVAVVYGPGRVEHLSARHEESKILPALPQLSIEHAEEPTPESFRHEVMQWHEKGVGPEHIANMLYVNVDLVKQVIERERPSGLSDFDRKVLEGMREGMGRGAIFEWLKQVYPEITEHQVRKVMDRVKKETS